MAIPFYWVDSFASSPFRGNAAGVCFLDGPATDDWMRGLTDEMSLSEIAFLWGEGTDWKLRWFTPAKEVDLCGHATLAASHILYETGKSQAGSKLSFETRSGTLTAKGQAGEIELDFPSVPPAACPPPPGLERLTGPILYCGDATRDLIVELPDAESVRRLSFSGRDLLAVTDACILATARSDDGKHQVISRFFAPSYGIDEDPVTGSAHCVLAPYWAPKLGVNRFSAFQASARGGDVGVELVGDRVKLTGSALTLMKGEVLVGP